jgi:hypothetical protein
VAEGVAASNLPASSGTFVIASLHKLTWPTSAPFRVRAHCSYPASYPRPPTEKPANNCLGFLLPFGHRHWLLGPSFPRWAISVPHSPLTSHGCGWAPTGLSRSTRSSHDRGGCPLYPEAHGVS